MTDLAPADPIAESGGEIVWFEGLDGMRLRAAHWPAMTRGTVLLLNGRAEYIEKHLEAIAELQARGFAVWTMDWRGQGQSGRLLPDRLRHHILSFDDYLADAGQLLDTAIVSSLRDRPLVMIAHSMGGHLGARILSQRPELFARAVLCSPMIDFLRGGPLLRVFARLVFKAGCLKPSQVTRFGPGTSPRPRLDTPFEGNRLTTCAHRYEYDIALLRSLPDMHLGGCTWGWLRAASDSIATLLRTRVMRRIAMPVLIALAGADRVVDNKAMRQFAHSLPQARIVEIPGAAHELLRENDQRRSMVWAEIDRFLESVG